MLLVIATRTTRSVICMIGLEQIAFSWCEACRPSHLPGLVHGNHVSHCLTVLNCTCRMGSTLSDLATNCGFFVNQLSVLINRPAKWQLNQCFESVHIGSQCGGLGTDSRRMKSATHSRASSRVESLPQSNRLHAILNVFRVPRILH